MIPSMNAALAIELSRAQHGKAVVMDHFTNEDEVYLANVSEQWFTKDDPDRAGYSLPDHTVYSGAGWQVELIGNGDPR